MISARFFILGAALLMSQGLLAQGDEASSNYSRGRYGSRQRQAGRCLPKPQNSCSPCYEPQQKIENPKCLSKGYNEPAAIDVHCGLNMFATGGFIYWQALEDGLDLGYPYEANLLVPAAIFGPNGDVVTQKFEYKPGFKIGLGWNSPWDHWVLYGEYTRIAGSSHTSRSATNPSLEATQIGAINPLWIDSLTTNSAVYLGRTSSEWNYNLNILDIQVSRPYYLGIHFTVEPFFGPRVVVFSQSFDVHYRKGVLISTPRLITDNISNSYNKSNSWALGPRAGVNGSWFIGRGFRFIGNANVSVLYTQFKVKEKQNGFSVQGNTNIHLKHYNAIRPEFGGAFGFGWGRYLNCQNYHLDFTATYEFNVFLGQNMMRYVDDMINAHTGAYPGSFTTQGLTLTGRFDF